MNTVSPWESTTRVVTTGERERVVCGVTNAADLRRKAKAKQGRTLSVYALERGDEEREDSCAAGGGGVAVTSKGRVALPDTVHKLGITAEPALMLPGFMLHKGG